MAAREIKCPSGALLKVHPAVLADSMALYQCFLKEVRTVDISRMSSQMEVGNLFKEFLCAAISSEDVERCLYKCMERCTYNSNGADLKIVRDTFEPALARQDLMLVFLEVLTENVSPFLKGVWQSSPRLLELVSQLQK